MGIGGTSIPKRLLECHREVRERCRNKCEERKRREAEDKKKCEAGEAPPPSSTASSINVSVVPRVPRSPVRRRSCHWIGNNNRCSGDRLFKYLAGVMGSAKAACSRALSMSEPSNSCPQCSCDPCECGIEGMSEEALQRYAARLTVSQRGPLPVTTPPAVILDETDVPMTGTNRMGFMEWDEGSVKGCGGVDPSTGAPDPDASEECLFSLLDDISARLNKLDAGSCTTSSQCGAEIMESVGLSLRCVKKRAIRVYGAVNNFDDLPPLFQGRLVQTKALYFVLMFRFCPDSDILKDWAGYKNNIACMGWGSFVLRLEKAMAEHEARREARSDSFTAEWLNNQRPTP